MVITKHYAVHGKKYRRQLIKYILEPKKTRNLSLISDFGMSNYLDFPDYMELVKMYQNNFLSNDKLYDSRFDRQEKKQQKIHAHHVIQSFSPEDNLSPEEINRIGYKTIKELTGGQYKFIVATHVDQDHCHNHIIINSINSQSQKKLKWDYAFERNLQMISDRISKVAGAKIIPPKRYSHRDYEVYRRSNHKYELKQRLFFLMEHSIDFNDFIQKSEQLNIKIDFSRKHSRFFMTDRDMKQVIRGDKLNKREPYSKEYFQYYFSKKKIEQILEFLLPRSNSFDDLVEKAGLLGLELKIKIKTIDFVLSDGQSYISIPNKSLSKKNLYDTMYFESYFKEHDVVEVLHNSEVKTEFEKFESQQLSEILTEEEITEAYETYKTKRDAVHEFEVEISEELVEKVVSDGLFIKVWMGIGQEGLIFIPNHQLNILEQENKKQYMLFIRETSSYFIFHKENSEKNHFMKGRDLIRQLAYDNRSLPYKKRISLVDLQQKIEEINLLITLNTQNKSFLELKDELVEEIAQLDIDLTNLQEKNATLNKMAEVILNLQSEDQDAKRLAKYECSKMNLSKDVTIEQIESEIEMIQNQLYNRIEEYENAVRKLDEYVRILNMDKYKTDDFSINID
ncbi:relaxase/mobilization nuclease domain-containing protein [Streptococcus suis]|uniref:Tn5252, relaxase n=2 Tax=Streptococcus suis TaxID=1307 RepID=A0A0Z8TRL8_STRSU|nr:SAG1250 family conjugative relaxase [Streptococcus suis]AXN76655.1 Tn5252 family relaxase [Streptococcus suis]MBY4961709.1 relaxase/mobilization nuclease domain-containing protein [Streptococcus suis]MBY4967808.1 relaxase/mobilization nuclease domain-containing protein [Streptococcus suis]MBY4978942.1 relaxase/mobilization nuclease domain-containing protein [Streptococcus suis]MBY4987452.1 relaxase/mobilization nuclease domain-containing protein [Streptococcus suis]